MSVEVPGKVLAEAIKWSRQGWTNTPDEEVNQAFQCSRSITVSETHELTHIGGEPLDPERIYSTALYTYDMSKAPAFKEYAATCPGKIPNAEASRPVITLLVEYFCARLWKRLVDTDGDGHVTLEELLKFVEDSDKDKSGILSFDEVAAAVKEKLGNSSVVVAEQMMAMLDADSSGTIDIKEAKALLAN